MKNVIQAGLMLGLLVLAFMLVFGQEDPVVIKLGEETETLSEFNDRFEIAIRSLAAAQGIELTDEVRAQVAGFKPQFLERRIVELLLLEEAATRELSVSDEVLDERITELMADLPEGETVESFVEAAGFSSQEQMRAMLREDTLLQETVEALESEIEISDEDLQLAYDENIEAFALPEQVCARHILLDTVEDAEAVLAELEEGGDFAELAVDYSTGPSGPNGGDLSCFGRGQMVPPFEEAAFAAEVDVPVGPVETQFGQHLILVYQKDEGGTASLEEVSVPLTEQLRQEKLNEKIESLRDVYEVETFPEVLAAEASPEGPTVEDGEADANEEDAEPSEDADESETEETDSDSN